MLSTINKGNISVPYIVLHRLQVSSVGLHSKQIATAWPCQVNQIKLMKSFLTFVVLVLYTPRFQRILNTNSSLLLILSRSCFIGLTDVF